MFNRCLRITRIIVSVVIFTLMTLSLVAPALTIPILTPWLKDIQLVPALLANSVLTVVGWIMLTLIFGRIYCSSVCPLGTLQDIAARVVRLRKPVKRYRYRSSQWTLRFIFLGLMVTVLLLQNLQAVTILDPYGSFARIFEGQGWMLTIPSAIVILMALALAMYSGRSYCNTICPVGTTLGLMSRSAIFQIDIDTDKCINCGKCADVCKGACIKLPDHVVNGSRCVTCFNCLTVCPNDAIHYTHRRKQLSIPMMQSIADPLKNKEKDLGTVMNIKNITNTNETVS